MYFTIELDDDDDPNDTGEQLLSNINSELKLRRITLRLLSIPENNTRGEILTSPPLSAAAAAAAATVVSISAAINRANDGLRGGGA